MDQEQLLWNEQERVEHSFLYDIDVSLESKIKLCPEERGEVQIRFVNHTFHDVTGKFDPNQFYRSRNGWRIFAAIEREIERLEERLKNECKHR